MEDTNNHDSKAKIEFSGDISTYMDSYRVHRTVRAERYRPKRENTDRPTPKCKPRKILDLQTFTPLKHEIPFGLMIVPNDVTGRNPLAPIQHIEMPEDEKKEEVMKKRPRIYKSPQVSLDEVPDPDMRKIILDHTYTSESKRMNHDLCNLIGLEYREEPETVLEHKEFLTTSKKHYFEVCFKPKSSLQIKMTPEQNRRGSHWEKGRIIGTANSTEHFWKKNKQKYGSRNNDVLSLVERNIVDEIKKLVENDELDIQHDKISPGYAGYISNVAVGVDIHKKDIPHNHPLLSTYQETFNWKIDKNNSKTIS